MSRFAGERSALAATVLAFYGFIFFLVALNPPPDWGACFTALAVAYGIGFFSLVAGYFWARWYSIGLGMSGLISAAVSVWQIGPEPVLLFYGATHGFISLVLWGDAVAARFDGQQAWRARFHIDENGAHRLGKAVIRAGISLPYILMYALAPKQPASVDAAIIAALLAVGGTWALVKMRTWGVIALAASAATVAVTLISQSALRAGEIVPHSGLGGSSIDVTLLGVGALAFLVAAVAPFARPMVSFLRGR
jgi:hypothetical protein